MNSLYESLLQHGNWASQYGIYALAATGAVFLVYKGSEAIGLNSSIKKTAIFAREVWKNGWPKDLEATPQSIVALKWEYRAEKKIDQSEKALKMAKEDKKKAQSLRKKRELSMEEQTAVKREERSLAGAKSATKRKRMSADADIESLVNQYQEIINQKKYVHNENTRTALTKKQYKPNAMRAEIQNDLEKKEGLTQKEVGCLMNELKF